ncbi:MAG TPA: 2'-deoxycytidine 5'-triphosphate deaminase [Clostridia bacterium]|nr:2'-deoxycytidine 5'-triphosphate deaminase [Clostridia bacterium]
MTSSGVLPRQALRSLVAAGAISSPQGVPERNLQPASVDLTLGAVAYRLRCSFLPGSFPVERKLRDYQMGSLDLTDGAVLEQNRPYLIPLNERLRLPAGVRGRTNPRSSTGRIDVFTRVVTDFGQHFDEVKEGYEGGLYLEVVPRSFTIKVKAGLTLNQLRLTNGAARLSDAELIELGATDPIVYPGGSEYPDERAVVSDGLFLSVDLSGEGRRFAGYKARKSSALLDLQRTGYYNVRDFFERVEPRGGRLILDPEDFYLLVSRERVRIPPDYAAEMAAYDPTSGELRTHYAGFFDPGFGDVPAGERAGTPAVLEVRAHDVPFALEHGQRLCRLTFERMAERPEAAYGSAIGSRYQRQYLALGRQFKPDESAARSPARPKTTEAQPLPLQSWAGDDVDLPPLAVAPRE